MSPKKNRSDTATKAPRPLSRMDRQPQAGLKRASAAPYDLGAIKQVKALLAEVSRDEKRELLRDLIREVDVEIRDSQDTKVENLPNSMVFTVGQKFKQDDGDIDLTLDMYGDGLCLYDWDERGSFQYLVHKRSKYISVAELKERGFGYLTPTETDFSF